MSQPPTANALRDLLSAMAGHFRAHHGPAAGPVSTTIAMIARRPTLDLSAPSAMPPRDRPILPQTPDPLFDRALAGAADRLRWWVPDADKIPSGMTSRMWVCEIIGPDGMIRDETLRAGLYLQGSDLVYDWHSHAADELYIAMSGIARWQAAGREPAEPHPIAFIHHSPWQSHAMITGNDPLFALWAWTGDIAFDSYRMD